MLVTALLASLLLVYHLVNAGPRQENRHVCIEEEATHSVECTYTSEDSEFDFPEVYSNMTLQIFSPSGGRTLNKDNVPEDHTRGLGIHFSATFADNLKNLTFEIHNGPNGGDARVDGPGLNPPSSKPIIGGSGGSCANSTYARFGAAGGSSSGITRKPNSIYRKQMTLYISGGGGGGAFDPHGTFESLPKGGDSPLLKLRKDGSGSGHGIAGSPAIISGTGGIIMKPGKGGTSLIGGGGRPGFNTFYNGGAGGSGLGSTFCLSGGGGGSGFRGAGGGAAVGSRLAFDLSAGSGASGGSVLLQDPGFMFEIKQTTMFTENPKVVFRYSTRPPSDSCLEGVCAVMRRIRV